MTTESSRVLASGARPPRPSATSAAITFGWRVLLKLKHVPEEWGDAVGVPLMFTVLFTYLFGGALAGSTGRYLQFLLPGTLVLAVVFVTVYSGVNLNADLRTGAFDRFRSLPIWRGAPIAGGLIGDAGRYLLASALVIGLGLVMGFDPHGGALGVLAAIGLVILFSMALSLAWLALGLVLRTPRAVMSVGFVILFPITFISNVFVEPRTMPAVLRTIARVNPISHLTTAARGLMLGGATAGEVLWVLAATAVLAAAFAPLAAHLYARAE
jgi:daunorubicin/doxorubicin transport system permease protein